MDDKDQKRTPLSEEKREELVEDAKKHVRASKEVYEALSMKKNDLRTIRKVLASYDVVVKRVSRLEALVNTSRLSKTAVYKMNETLQEAGYWTIVSDEWVHVYFEWRSP